MFKDQFINEKIDRQKMSNSFLKKYNSLEEDYKTFIYKMNDMGKVKNSQKEVDYLDDLARDYKGDLFLG